MISSPPNNTWYAKTKGIDAPETLHWGGREGAQRGGLTSQLFDASYG